VESSKADVAAAFRAPFDLIGAKVQTGSEYPGWKPNPSSKIVQKMADIYQKKFGHPPVIEACHAVWNAASSGKLTKASIWCPLGH
jgi:dipeptidase D